MFDSPRSILLASSLLIPLAMALGHACTGSKKPGTPDPESIASVANDSAAEQTHQAVDHGLASAVTAGVSGRVHSAAAGAVPPAPVCDLGVPDGSGGCIVTPADRRGAMSAEQKWNHVLTECPSDDFGPITEVWNWVPSDLERQMMDLDLGGAGTIFRSMADFEGTSIILKIKDGTTQENLAVIKTTSSNTRSEAEVYAHRLGTFLGFGDMIPDVAAITLNGGALDKTIEMLRALELRDANKAQRRDRVLASVEAARREGTGFDAAMKPWLRAFMFHSGLGHRESLATSEVMRFLKASGPQPTDSPTQLRQYTRMYEPLGTHQGVIAMSQLAEDLSNLMLLDALMGQNDRFPGGNVHFMSVNGIESETGEIRRERPVFDMGEVRLLALDNGAALHSASGSGIGDLRGQTVPGTKVERFDRESIERLRALGRRTLGRACDHPPFPEEVQAIWTYLGVAPDQFARVEGYLRNTLDYLDTLEAAYGDDMYLQPVSGGAAAGAGPQVMDGEE